MQTKYPSDKLEHELAALSTARGEVVLVVFVVGGVTKGGKELDPEPWKDAWPTLALAKNAARKLGPKCWASEALVPIGKVMKWAKS